MTTQRARKKEARRLAAAEGIPYSQALARIAQATPTNPAPDDGPRYVLEPTAVETALGITQAELGVRALAPDATPQHRAAAEAHWRENPPEDPCRCSGPCRHGTACEEEIEEADEDRVFTIYCDGSLIHVDRYPGSMLGVTTWEDEYRCGECGEGFTVPVTLPALPWGEYQPNTSGQGGATVVYDRVRRPAFPDFDSDTPEHPAGNGQCAICGGYALEGLLCEGCRAESYTDAYGMISEPDTDDEDLFDWDDYQTDPDDIAEEPSPEDYPNRTDPDDIAEEPSAEDYPQPIEA